MDDVLSERSEAEWAALRGWVERTSTDSADSYEAIPFVYLLDPEHLKRMRVDLLTVLMESDHAGEAVDVREIEDILREFTELAGWDGPIWVTDAEELPAYRLDVQAKDIKALRNASPAVQRVVEQLFSGPLIENPFGLSAEVSQRVKKMPDRDLWQVYLPDGFRLRYYVDEPERTVHVVYLGPHSDSRNDGREAAVRQAVHRRRLERRKEADEPGA